MRGLSLTVLSLCAVAVASTFTFTPTKAGAFHWYCALPCGGSMGGTIYAIEGALKV
jgi:heme/copper-type cytochrome/quinol oxidase subunit 2